MAQHRADENVWTMRFVAAGGTETTVCHINIYVDDILYDGLPSAIEAVHEWPAEDWKASPLTFLGPKLVEPRTVRFHQRAYIEEFFHAD